MTIYAPWITEQITALNRYQSGPLRDAGQSHGTEKKVVGAYAPREPRGRRSWSVRETDPPDHSKRIASTVLVIDCDRAVRDTFARTLRVAGYDVHTVATRQAAVRTIRTQTPDAILMEEVCLPTSTDGLALLRDVRVMTPQLPIAVVTRAYLLEDRIKRTLRRLGVALHFKPLWLEDVVALAATLLSAPNAPGSAS